MIIVLVMVVCWKLKSVTKLNVKRLRPPPVVPRRPLQTTTGQGRTPNQDEGHYYEILPDGSARRVMVSQPAESQPSVPSRSLQSTISQEHAPDQEEEHIYYEILPNLSARRVVSRPAQSQPAIPSRPLQSTTDEAHAPGQDERHIYCEILPNLPERRVVSQPDQDSEGAVYDDVLPEDGVQPRSPVYTNVPPDAAVDVT